VIIVEFRVLASGLGREDGFVVKVVALFGRKLRFDWERQA